MDNVNLAARFLESIVARPFSRRIVVAGSAGIAATALVGSVPKAASQDAQTGGTIRFGIAYDTPLFDQLRSGTSPLASQWIFENLVVRAEDGSYQPWVAESWITSDDGLETTFTLKPDIRFHDGTPLDASAVKWFYDMARDPEGEHAFSTSYEAVSDIQVVDDLTVTFTFSTPFVGFLETIASSFAGLISPTAYEDAGDQYGVSVVIGSGPFKLSEWTPNDTMVVERYEEYAWAPEARASNPGPALLDSAVIRVIPEAATAVASLEAGELDVLYSVPVQDYERLQENEDFTFATRPRYGGALLYIAMNHARETFQDINVRRAINHAIDREGIATAVYKNIAGEAAYGYLPPHFEAHFPDAESIGYPYDPEAAQQLLEEAGYTLGEDGVQVKDGEPLRLTFIAMNRTDEMAVAQVVQSNLEEVGIEVEVVTQTPSAAYDLALTGEYDLFLGLWGWGSPDILNIVFQTGAESNVTALSDPELDELLSAGATASTIEDRNARYRESDQYLIEQAPWVPLIFQTDLVAVRQSVHGFGFDDLGDVTFPTDWWIE